MYIIDEDNAQEHLDILFIFFKENRQYNS